MTEYSERAWYVTELVSLWLANEDDFVEKYGYAMAARDGRIGKRVAEVAAEFAHAGKLEELRLFVEPLIMFAGRSRTAWEVRQELGPNDYRRIVWTDVAAELKATFDV